MRSAVVLCSLLCVTSSCSQKTQTDKRAPAGPSMVVPASVSVATNRDLLEVNYGWSDNARESDAVAEAVRGMKEMSESKQPPKVAIVFATGTKYQEEAVHAALKANLDPHTKIWGMSTPERGLLTPNGRHFGLAVMGLYASEMKVGIGQAAFPDWKNYGQYEAIGKEVITAALKDAGYTPGGPKPKAVLFASMNLITDTKILRGIGEIIGDDVPIIGGNSIEDTMEMAGGWGYSTDAVKKNVVTVAAIWADRKMGVAYGFGYKKTDHKGIVTKSDIEKRVVYEIDHKPAAEVYNGWLGGAISDLIKKGGGQIPFGVFSEYPFSKPIGDKPDEHVMMAPLALNPDKSIFMSHEGIEEGKEVTVYKLDNDDVTVKSAMVATLAMAAGGVSQADLAGSLMLYCDAPFAGGKAQPDGIIPSYSVRTGHKPFLGFFASGEIGYSPRGGNRTLAYSTVSLVFGKTRTE